MCVEWIIPQRTQKQTDIELNNFITTHKSV